MTAAQQCDLFSVTATKPMAEEPKYSADCIHLLDWATVQQVLCMIYLLLSRMHSVAAAALTQGTWVW